VAFPSSSEARFTERCQSRRRRQNLCPQPWHRRQTTNKESGKISRALPLLLFLISADPHLGHFTSVVPRSGTVCRFRYQVRKHLSCCNPSSRLRCARRCLGRRRLHFRFRPRVSLSWRRLAVELSFGNRMKNAAGKHQSTSPSIAAPVEIFGVVLALVEHNHATITAAMPLKVSEQITQRWRLTTSWSRGDDPIAKPHPIITTTTQSGTAFNAARSATAGSPHRQCSVGCSRRCLSPSPPANAIPASFDLCVTLTERG
jgi:hypothetical protein